MDKLWAPWRSKYIYSRKRKGCIFCEKPTGKKTDRYVIGRAKHSFSMLNLYPYNNGHVMVAPCRHVRSLELLSDAEITDLMRLVNKMKLKIDKLLKPDGYNIGINIGKTGGAGYAGHLHIHIVPRWVGDTNFMPVLSGTKVISESLDAMSGLLKKR
ncbi:MAG: HIT domain-containing protein [Candidatus Omnitrophica bacterium]|nr:HIT domain-containing protein [Candidatus Omnitrophota bacterium]